MNRSAAALAADSAVTFGSGKVYDSVNKLFTLSKYHPVGIMIYNNASFMDVPWETIIKEYRSQLGSEARPTVSAYADDFCGFLQDQTIVTKESRVSHWVQVYRSLSIEIARDLMMKAVASDSRSRAARHRILYPLIEAKIKDLTKGAIHQTTEPVTQTELQTELGQHIEKIHDSIWRQQYRIDLTKKAETLLLRAFHALVRSCQKSSSHSGIVIAGFGSEEIFPSLVNLEFDGAYGATPKIVLRNDVDVGRKPGSTNAFIQGFAQTDMVQRFVFGREKASLDPFLRQYASQMLKTAVKEIVNHSAPEPNQRQLSKDLLKKVPAWTESLIKAVDENCWERYASPLLETVAGLPKPEMADLAEALVNLTSVKRKMSADAETVGGPIDVALISKGDGFVWIKRKHYFDIALNPSFGPNYFRFRDDEE